jgi:hypothetical protein
MARRSLSPHQRRGGPNPDRVASPPIKPFPDAAEGSGGRAEQLAEGAEDFRSGDPGAAGRRRFVGDFPTSFLGIARGGEADGHVCTA